MNLVRGGGARVRLRVGVRGRVRGGVLLPLLLPPPPPAHLLVENALPATERLHLGLERDRGGAELCARLLEERLRDAVLALELGALLEQVRLHREAGGRG